MSKKQQAADEHLKRELKKLTLAIFDVDCADALAALLEDHERSISPLAWGLLTGMTVSYARPFVESRDFGRLGSRSYSFPSGRRVLHRHHHFLMELRNKLLAHNAETAVRVVVVFPRGAFTEYAMATETRTGIRVEGVQQSRDLFRFQLERMKEGRDKLAARLDALGAIPPEGLEF